MLFNVILKESMIFQMSFMLTTDKMSIKMSLDLRLKIMFIKNLKYIHIQVLVNYHYFCSSQLLPPQLLPPHDHHTNNSMSFISPLAHEYCFPITLNLA